MIGWLSGNIIERTHPGKLVIDVHGVGYDVETSLQTFFQIEMQTEQIGLHIHTVVREDAILLYGFHSQEERALFKELIKVNGVGPKMAITILSSITPEEFIHSIHTRDANILTKLPGIGKKTAERLIIEMQDKLKEIPGAIPKTHKAVITKPEQEAAIKALESLGYKFHQAEKAVKKIDDGTKGCEQLIKDALHVLAGF